MSNVFIFYFILQLKTAIENEIKCYPMNAQSPVVPKGFELDNIKKEKEKEKERLKHAKDVDENIEALFEGKTIRIEPDISGQGLRINIVSPKSENKRAFTQIARQFLTGEYCLTGVSFTLDCFWEKL